MAEKEQRRDAIVDPRPDRIEPAKSPSFVVLLDNWRDGRNAGTVLEANEDTLALLKADGVSYRPANETEIALGSPRASGV